MNRTDQATTNPGLRIAGGTWQVFSATLILLLALAVGQIVLLRKRLEPQSRISSTYTDSMKLARGYGAIVREAFDLQQELDARNTGRIPARAGSFVTPPGARLGMRPVPIFSSSLITREDRNAVLAALQIAGSSRQRAGVEFVYTQRDFVETGAFAMLENLGFQPQLSRSSTFGSTNSITFGDSVPIAYVREVAFVLVGRGINVHRIRRFEAESARRRLEIGYEPYADSWPPLTLDQLTRMTAP